MTVSELDGFLMSAGLANSLMMAGRLKPPRRYEFKFHKFLKGYGNEVR